MSIKETLMNKMMDKQFSNMSPEDKQNMMEGMMDKFFSSMSDEERKNMMSDMMPKMMGKMMGNSGDNPMMGMMSMMMNGNKRGHTGKMPWDMCKDMMTNMSEVAQTARFATPELRGLFDDWCQQIEGEILEFLKENKNPGISELAEKFSLSEDSIRYLLNQLASKNKISYNI